jgi:hypothetical protein
MHGSLCAADAREVDGRAGYEAGSVLGRVSFPNDSGGVPIGVAEDESSRTLPVASCRWRGCPSGLTRSRGRAATRRCTSSATPLVDPSDTTGRTRVLLVEIPPARRPHTWPKGIRQLRTWRRRGQRSRRLGCDTDASEDRVEDLRADPSVSRYRATRTLRAARDPPSQCWRRASAGSIRSAVTESRRPPTQTTLSWVGCRNPAAAARASVRQAAR